MILVPVNLSPLSPSLLMYPTHVESPLVVPISERLHALALRLIRGVHLLPSALGSTDKSARPVMSLTLWQVPCTLGPQHPTGAGRLFATILSSLRHSVSAAMWLVPTRPLQSPPVTSVNVRVSRVIRVERLVTPLLAIVPTRSY